MKEKNSETKREQLRMEKVPGVLEEDVLVAVNGVNYLIPRGKTVEVPFFVAAEYRRSLRAAERLFNTQEKRLYKNAAEDSSRAESNAVPGVTD